MTWGLAVLLVSVVLALTVGAWRAHADGRFGIGRSRRQEQAVLPAEQLGGRATLLQFSSAFCAPCRATRRVLSEVAEAVPGVAHVELDAEQHLELVRRVGVLRTPTTLVLDHRGREVTRASGAPRKEQVLSALASIEGEAGSRT